MMADQVVDSGYYLRRFCPTDAWEIVKVESGYLYRFGRFNRERLRGEFVGPFSIGSLENWLKV